MCEGSEDALHAMIARSFHTCDGGFQGFRVDCQIGVVVVVVVVVVAAAAAALVVLVSVVLFEALVVCMRAQACTLQIILLPLRVFELAH